MGNQAVVLEEELGRFEKEVGAVPVPGEVAGWCRSLQTRLHVLSKAWEEQLQSHESRLEEILREDIELARRVQNLRKSRTFLSTTLESFRERADRLLDLDAEEPQGSWEPVEAANGLRRDMLEWIVSCRAHDREVRSWFLEATHRDRGVVD